MIVRLFWMAFALDLALEWPCIDDRLDDLESETVAKTMLQCMGIVQTLFRKLLCVCFRYGIYLTSSSFKILRKT